jgi:hypothetical protein
MATERMYFNGLLDPLTCHSAASWDKLLTIINPIQVFMSSRHRPRVLWRRAVLPEPDLDYLPLARALADRAVLSKPCQDGPDVGRFRCLRHSIDLELYYDHTISPLVDTTWTAALINPAAVVRENVDKRYLRGLQNNGVPIVETLWFEQGQPADRSPSHSRSPLVAVCREAGHLSGVVCLGLSC